MYTTRRGLLAAGDDDNLSREISEVIDGIELFGPEWHNSNKRKKKVNE